MAEKKEQQNLNEEAFKHKNKIIEEKLAFMY